MSRENQPTRVAKHPCGTCPFSGSKPLNLSSDRLGEIIGYLARGTNHLCHSDQSNETVCRGGRDIQLRHMVALGMIEAPTDEALAKAMRAAGVEPGNHIQNDKE